MSHMRQMTYRERIESVLHHQTPDRVPFVPYDNLVPRGSFERALRNRGMSLCLRRRWLWAEMPHVSVEHSTDGDVRQTAYRTPAGTVFTRDRTHVSREFGGIELDGLIKGPEDFEPVIAMVEDTVYHVDAGPYHDAVRDVGEDGIVRVTAFEGSPYDEALEYFGMGTTEGLAGWAYALQDHPTQLARLVAALERRAEQALALIVDCPAEFVSLGSLDGFYGPRQFEEEVVPFYQKVTAALHARGKLCSLHAHTSQLRDFAALIGRAGFDVVEAFSPPPYSDLPLAEARAAWGDDTVIWVNFPETIFYSGAEATRQYTSDLLHEDAPGRSLVIGFTESGLGSIVDDEVERVFKAGFLAITEALEREGAYPVSAAAG